MEGEIARKCEGELCVWGMQWLPECGGFPNAEASGNEAVGYTLSFATGILLFSESSHSSNSETSSGMEKI